MPKRIQDEYTNRSDLSSFQKYKLRHPEKWKSIKNQNLRRKWEDWDEKERAAYHLKKRYGISFVDYEEMFTLQNKKCKICSKELELLGKNYNRAVVDHCHSSGEIRGLLCNPCNKALGIIKDSKEVLQKMINYLNGVSNG